MLTQNIHTTAYFKCTRAHSDTYCEKKKTRKTKKNILNHLNLLGARRLKHFWDRFLFHINATKCERDKDFLIKRKQQTQSVILTLAFVAPTHISPPYDEKKGRNVSSVCECVHKHKPKSNKPNTTNYTTINKEVLARKFDLHKREGEKQWKKRYNKIFTVNKRKFAYALLHHQNIKNYFSSLPIRSDLAGRLAETNRYWLNEQHQSDRQDGKWLCTLRRSMLVMMIMKTMMMMMIKHQ